MSTFSLNLDLRRELWSAGYGRIDQALRSAAVELDFWFFGKARHWQIGSDGDTRHFTQFLMWSDSAVVSIARVVRSTGNQHLIARVEALEDEGLRPLFRRLRNETVHELLDGAPWEVEVVEDNILIMQQVLHGAGRELPAYGTAQDYLSWIRDRALPLLSVAIARGARGSQRPDLDIDIGGQMPFGFTPAWTAREDPEFRLVLALDSDA